MTTFLVVLLIALLPAAGNVAGGLLAEVLPRSERRLSLALHAAVGVVLAVVGVEIMPRALEAEVPWIVVLAFVLGGGFFILMDAGVDLAAERMNVGERHSRSWMIYFGVTVDLFSDGLMVGSGATIELGLGLLLALGQVTADIPEGFATIATFRERRPAGAPALAQPVLRCAHLGRSHRRVLGGQRPAGNRQAGHARVHRRGAHRGYR